MKVVGPVAEIVAQTRELIALSQNDLKRCRREIELIRDVLERNRGGVDLCAKVRRIQYALIVK